MNTLQQCIERLDGIEHVEEFQRRIVRPLEGETMNGRSVIRFDPECPDSIEIALASGDGYVVVKRQYARFGIGIHETPLGFSRKSEWRQHKRSAEAASWKSFMREVAGCLSDLLPAVADESKSSATREEYGELYHRDGFIYACWEFRQMTWPQVVRELKNVAADHDWPVIDKDDCGDRARGFAKAFGLEMRVGNRGRPRKK